LVYDIRIRNGWKIFNIRSVGSLYRQHFL
jgi:hypothetical protein